MHTKIISIVEYIILSTWSNSFTLFIFTTDGQTRHNDWGSGQIQVRARSYANSPINLSAVRWFWKSAVWFLLWWPAVIIYGIISREIHPEIRGITLQEPHKSMWKFQDNVNFTIITYYCKWKNQQVWIFYIVANFRCRLL